MHDVLMSVSDGLLAVTPLELVKAIWPYLLIVLGFSAVIFVHELGHFAVAKWAGVRVEKFCIGFGRELLGFTRGETRYGFNILPLGGYVKMLGQEDFEVDTTGELQAKDDPRSFANKSVAARMAIVSAGVIMNVIFAGLLFMIVYMVGMQVVVPDVGLVQPNSPAALAGLQVGDKVVRIDGKPINEFNEIVMAVMLSDPHVPLDFEVLRGDRLKHLKLLPEIRDEPGKLMVGMGPAVTRTIVRAPLGFDPERTDLPKPGDQIVEIDGQAVTDENANEMYYAMVNDPGRSPKVVVERPEDPEVADSPTQRVEVVIRPTLQLSPSDRTSAKSISVLGFSPLMRFDFVQPKGRSAKAGLEAGDVILRIGAVDYPSYGQIAQTIRELCTQRTGPGPDDYNYVENDIPIVVQRSGQGAPIETAIRAKVRRRLLKRNGAPSIEASFRLIANDVLRIGQPVETIGDGPSPAAVAGVPAGAVLQKVNGVTLNSWIDLVEQFRVNAGTTVTLDCVDADGQAAGYQVAVPHSLRTRMGLPVASSIVSVDGAETVDVEVKGSARTASIRNWYGLKMKLAQCVGKTVTVGYLTGSADRVQEARVEITADMVDPWLGRVRYQPNVLTSQARKLFRTSNPIEAIEVGARKTTYFILNVYTTIKRMVFTRTVGVEHLAGPVGIVKMGRDVASVGFNQLLFFLAIISANLAVLNFLPLPIVDGGLMVFLIIEKIKGTPVSIKTQVVTQVIGLVLIIAAFLFVTYQDIQRMFG
ncbi:MAG: RIP metalloprotease RseP [Phycisphaerae bacterium]